MPRYVTDFARVSKCSFSQCSFSSILGNVKSSSLIGLKSNNFVFVSLKESLLALSQSVTTFSLLLMILDIKEEFALP